MVILGSISSFETHVIDIQGCKERGIFLVNIVSRFFRVSAMRKILLILFLIFLVLILLSCQTGRGGEDWLYRTKKHLELHVLKFYKQLTELHKDIDRYIFDLDIEDPENY
jgi:hypothetical protein